MLLNNLADTVGAAFIGFGEFLTDNFISPLNLGVFFSHILRVRPLSNA